MLMHVRFKRIRNAFQNFYVIVTIILDFYHGQQGCQG